MNRNLEMISYECTQKIINQMKNNICNIKNNKNKQCTGFFCKIPFPDINNKMSVLITSNNIINNNEEKIYIKIKNENKRKIINMSDRIKYINKLNNIAIIEIKKEDNINDYLELDDNIIYNIINNKNNNNKYINKTIYILQYPENNLSVAYGKIETINKNHICNFNHGCKTKKESLGSPILNINNKVIGVYNKYDNDNKNCLFINNPIKKFIQVNKFNNNINNKIKLFEIFNTRNNLNISNIHNELKIFFEFNNKFINKKILNDFNQKYSLNIEDTNIENLDLNGKFIGNEGLKDLCKIKFINLKELNLSDNEISDIKELSNFDKLQKLDLSKNKKLEINILETLDLKELKKLYLNDNNISDINFLEKLKFNKLETLELKNNEIIDINVLEKVNFEELKKLDLSSNKIIDINILEKVKFQKLNILYLNENKISDINVFENVKFDNLILLDLTENNIIQDKDYSIISKLKTNIEYCNI